MKRLLLIVFALGFSGLVQANENVAYVGLGLGKIVYDLERDVTISSTDYTVKTKPEPSGLYLKVGGYLENNFGLEGRLAFGLAGYGDKYDLKLRDPNNTNTVLTETEAKAELESLLGLYATYRVPLGLNSSVYGLFGSTFGSISLTDETNDTEVSTDEDTSWSYGIGFNLVGFNVEVMSYLRTEDYEATAVNIGYLIQF